VADTGLTHDAWLERVPELVARWCEEWDLRLGEPYASGAGGHTARAELADGTPAVLKLVYPHRESEHEADALELWDGNGAVRVLARSDDGLAMLIERCVPGTPLAERGAEVSLDVLIALLPRLWVGGGEPFHTLVDEAAWWVSYLPRQWDDVRPPYPRRVLDAALDALTSLPPTQGELVLLHQDLHGENVLAAQREPWLVIDPKPLLGEREFAVAPIVRSFELGHSRKDVLHRFDRLTGELGLDRERARGWAIGQTLAWAFDSHWSVEHLDTALWLLEGV
jgi:streptomycin 6-kinase